MTRKRPNILITGTPGVGKTATASLIAERLGMKHINVGELIQIHKCYDGRDEDLDTNILDEDKLLDVMEPFFTNNDDSNSNSDSDNENDNGDDDTNDNSNIDNTNDATAVGGIVADYHICEIFPERWFDLVLVLRVQTEVLYDRLTARGYSDKKRTDNMQCEIMQIILEAAKDSYDPINVHEVPSNTLEDMESNVQRIQQWTTQWIQDNAK